MPILPIYSWSKKLIKAFLESNIMAGNLANIECHYSFEKKNRGQMSITPQGFISVPYSRTCKFFLIYTNIYSLPGKYPDCRINLFCILPLQKLWGYLN